MSFLEKIPSFIRLGRFLWKWTKRLPPPIFFTLVCLVTLVALVIAEENYRTGKAWEKYKTEAQARGVKFTLAELAPPPVPDDQNFFMTPFLKRHFSNSGSDQNADDYLHPDYPDGAENFGSRPDWKFGQSSLSWWAEWSRKYDILILFKKDEAKLAEISAALERPYSRIPSSKDGGSSILAIMQPATFFVSLAKIYMQRGMAELAAGQNEAALADAITLLRLSQTLRDSPRMIYLLTGISILGCGFEVIFEGLNAQRWTDAQLTELQKEIQKIDLLPQILQAEQAERALSNASLERFVEQDYSTRVSNFQKAFYFNGPPQPLPWQLSLLFRMPRSFFYTYALKQNEFYDQHGLLAINLVDRRINRDLLMPVSSPSKFDQMFNIEEPSKLTRGVISTTACAQTSLDEAALACALERYRLAHGNLPEKLAELVPQYIAQLPHDMITGQPLHYQRTDDGNFILYSTGWDGVDHHGEILKKDGFDERKDNWIWRYPAK